MDVQGLSGSDVRDMAVTPAVSLDDRPSSELPLILPDSMDVCYDGPEPVTRGAGLDSASASYWDDRSSVEGQDDIPSQYVL